MQDKDYSDKHKHYTIQPSDTAFWDHRLADFECGATDPAVPPIRTAAEIAK